MADLAKRQHGAVARWQLLAFGMSSSAIDRSIQAGRLHVIHAGVYAVGHPLLSWHGKLMAGVLCGGEGAVVSHVPAAALWDLLSSSSPAVHVTVPRRSGRSRPGLRIHQTRRLELTDRAEVNAIPVTSIPRTLSDIAAVVAPHRLERAVEQAVRMNRLDFGALAEVRDRSRGRRGIAALDALIAAFDPLAPQAHPGIEREFLRLIREARLERPRVNVQVGPYVVDFLWEDHKLIVELDSLEHHRRPAVFESDRKRDIDLQLAGYTVLRLTHRRLRQEPAAVAREVGYFLSACEPCGP